MSKPYIVRMIQSTGGWAEIQRHLYVSSERAARGVVRHFRDRVEHIIAEPIEVYTSRKAIEEMEEALGGRPDINEDYRQKRLEDEERGWTPRGVIR